MRCFIHALSGGGEELLRWGGEGVPAAAVAMAAVYRRVHESTRLSSWLVALETGGCEVKMFEDDLEDSG